MGSANENGVFISYARKDGAELARRLQKDLTAEAFEVWLDTPLEFCHGEAVTTDGRRAISASYDQTLKVWDLETGRELSTLEGHSNLVTGVAVTPDGRRAISASADHTLKVWDLESGRTIATFTCDAAARCCAFASRQIIVAGDEGGRVHVLSLEEGL